MPAVPPKSVEVVPPTVPDVVPNVTGATVVLVVGAALKLKFPLYEKGDVFLTWGRGAKCW